ncbi:probable rRNA maturation factor [Tistlia consotensis]|uniref:Endoribonuclease YbeY n=1 Tax=Tistlia consotensis USBA 355 TaxID=560819 RepID=A0A1Y6CLN5_9PROT|nr:rRNA maturation RNase YbeY [Tistlia consotensis]SMF74462.1 probable rRNA maturation factor [Tistlia consotensis USBA 355]SNS10656.1 probable rRNA maturation factor [Tistlia consotensis]
MGEPPSSLSPDGRNEIAVLVEDAAWTAALPAAEAIAERAALAALAAEAEPAEALELSVLLADDATVRDLNARYRGQDKPTNVLSFPAGLDEALPGEARLLGDLALAFGTCRREAEQQGKSLADHLSHLVVHGTLHLLGHDHEEEAEAERMEGRERAVLAGLGIADPYAEGAGDPGR